MLHVCYSMLCCVCFYIIVMYVIYSVCDVMCYVMLCYVTLSVTLSVCYARCFSMLWYAMLCDMMRCDVNHAMRCNVMLCYLTVITLFCYVICVMVC